MLVVAAAPCTVPAALEGQGCEIAAANFLSRGCVCNLAQVGGGEKQTKYTTQPPMQIKTEEAGTKKELWCSTAADELKMVQNSRGP
jgi:hypothetical protein